MSHFLLNGVRERAIPDYPPLAKNAGVEGRVRVKILVDRRGRLVQVCILDGHPLLREAALNAAAKFKFHPNFGLESPQPRRFLQDVLIFNFSLTGVGPQAEPITQGTGQPAAETGGKSTRIPSERTRRRCRGTEDGARSPQR